MGIKLGSTPITIPGIAKILRGETLIYSSAPAGPVNYTLAQKSVLEFDAANATFNSVCKIDDTHFAIAYCGADDNGFIKTFSVDGSYEITEIDSIEFNTVQGNYNSLILIDSTHLMLAYSGAGYDGYIATFSIDANCDNITKINELEYDTAQGVENSLVKIDSTHFALAYAGNGDDGYIAIFSINDSYVISKVSSIEHDAKYGVQNNLILLDSAHLLLVYHYTGSYCGVKTFSFNKSYAITQIDSEQLTPPVAFYISACKIDNTHFAIAYGEAATNDGYLNIVSIDGSYMISVVETVEYDTNYADQFSICLIDSTHLMLADNSSYQGPGRMKTFSINGSYELTEIDSLQHETTKNHWNSLILLDSTHVVLAYAGPDDDGYIKVFELD